LHAPKSAQESGFVQLEVANQLWQALFLLTEDCPEVSSVVPFWYRNFLKEKWWMEKSKMKRSSQCHMALSQTLSIMGVDHYNEHVHDIDVAIVLKDGASWTSETTNQCHELVQTKVAVEFDGPFHFTQPKPDWENEKDPSSGQSSSQQQPQPKQPVRAALGHTVLKYRMLKRQGWTVVRVPYYEFEKIPYWSTMASIS